MFIPVEKIDVIGNVGTAIFTIKHITINSKYIQMIADDRINDDIWKDKGNNMDVTSVVFSDGTLIIINYPYPKFRQLLSEEKL